VPVVGAQTCVTFFDRDIPLAFTIMQITSSETFRGVPAPNGCY